MHGETVKQKYTSVLRIILCWFGTVQHLNEYMVKDKGIEINYEFVAPK
jgi:hypothetical protein